MLSSVARDKLTEAPKAGEVAQSELLADAVRVVITDIRGALVTYAAGYTILGILAIITGIVLKKRRDGDKKPEAEENKPAEATKDTKQTDEPATREESKPTPKPPKKIQL